MQMQMESLGSAGGRPEAVFEVFWNRFDHNLERQSAASAVIEAVLDCDPVDRVLFLETILDQIRAGWPSSYNIDLIQEASYWADISTRQERKAYLWACWQRLPAADQSAFLRRVQGRAAA
ncbi:hypothetical protein [Paracoccus litorisediminis]|uniref:Uncharacterized protein n=1 Tax=Paracoccus litorisediminis TaxID=2006130 RepID=A0A844HMM3_9RHOB|nr:hypothetical protein [Paracoccus litorisediminis]MTH59001.1 hypothetical protein [Paracoccus litorisediminis]